MSFITFNRFIFLHLKIILATFEEYWRVSRCNWPSTCLVATYGKILSTIVFNPYLGENEKIHNYSKGISANDAQD